MKTDSFVSRREMHALRTRSCSLWLACKRNPAATYIFCIFVLAFNVSLLQYGISRFELGLDSDNGPLFIPPGGELPNFSLPPEEFQKQLIWPRSAAAKTLEPKIDQVFQDHLLRKPKKPYKLSPAENKIYQRFVDSSDFSDKYLPFWEGLNHYELNRFFYDFITSGSDIDAFGITEANILTGFYNNADDLPLMTMRAYEPVNGASRQVNRMREFKYELTYGYLDYTVHSDMTSQRQELLIAATVAGLLNRTLVVPQMYLNLSLSMFDMESEPVDMLAKSQHTLNERWIVLHDLEQLPIKWIFKGDYDYFMNVYDKKRDFNYQRSSQIKYLFPKYFSFTDASPKTYIVNQIAWSDLGDDSVRLIPIEYLNHLAPTVDEKYTLLCFGSMLTSITLTRPENAKLFDSIFRTLYTITNSILDEIVTDIINEFEGSPYYSMHITDQMANNPDAIVATFGHLQDMYDTEQARRNAECLDPLPPFSESILYVSTDDSDRVASIMTEMNGLVFNEVVFLNCFEDTINQLLEGWWISNENAPFSRLIDKAFFEHGRQLVNQMIIYGSELFCADSTTTLRRLYDCRGMFIGP